MAASIFTNPAAPPEAAAVAAALAETHPLWTELWQHVQTSYPDVSGQWKRYGKSSGWTFPVKSKKRTLFYFMPKSGLFAIHFTFGDRAAAAIEASSLPRALIDELLAATRYVEGRPLALDVTSAEQLEHVKLLLAIKHRH